MPPQAPHKDNTKYITSKDRISIVSETVAHGVLGSSNSSNLTAKSNNSKKINGLSLKKSVKEIKRLNGYADKSPIPHYSFVLKIGQDDRGYAYIHEANKGNTKATGRESGKVVQNGLSQKGKSKITTIANCYTKLIEDDEFYWNNNPSLEPNLYNKYCRFITLTFRNIIPTDDIAKRLLDVFFKRLRRKKGSNFHYVWVAEIQTKRLKKSGNRAIHFHILTPEKIYKDSDTDSIYKVRLEEQIWVNRVWNEIVCNWAVKSGSIDRNEGSVWSKEVISNEAHNRALYEYRNNKGRKPVKPSKSKYLMLPNVIHVDAAGRYMVKYMSKENENIEGNMYGISTESRKFLVQREIVKVDCTSSMYGNRIIDYLTWRSDPKRTKVFTSTFELPHNQCKGIYCEDAWRLLEWYYEAEGKAYHIERKLINYGKEM